MSTQTPVEPRAPPAQLEGLAPSAKLIAKVLEYEGDCTQMELAEATLLPPRTLRYGLDQLEDTGIVTSRVSFRDARQQVYSLAFQDDTE